jgi:hypothetical protein
MVAYSRCAYIGLSSKTFESIEAVRGEGRNVLTGDAARLIWRNRGKCPLTPSETVFILQAFIRTGQKSISGGGDQLCLSTAFASSSCSISGTKATCRLKATRLTP